MYITFFKCSTIYYVPGIALILVIKVQSKIFTIIDNKT